MKDSDALDGLLNAKSVSVIDLSHNNLEDPCIIDILEQLSSSVLINLGRNTINMLIYHKIAAQDSKRSHGGGSQIGDMEGSGLIDVLDEEIYNFKS